MTRREAVKEAEATSETKRDRGQERSTNLDDVQVVPAIRIGIMIDVTGDTPVLALGIALLACIVKVTPGHDQGPNLAPDERGTRQQTSGTR